MSLGGPKVKMDDSVSVLLEEHITKGLLVQLDSADSTCFGTGCVPLFSIMQSVFVS